jgi:hypothetical protein
VSMMLAITASPAFIARRMAKLDSVS